MKKDNLVYLEDIVDACNKILSYTNGMKKSDFESDTLTQDAVIRNITIIGEAASKITKEFTEEHSEFPTREAITMRNKLVHDYSFVDSDILWDTIIQDIPGLLNISKLLLNKH